jgi:hypothetical protein
MEQSAQVQPAPAPGALVLAPAVALSAPMVPVHIVAIASVTPATLPAFTPVALLNPAPAPKAKRTRKPAAPKSPAQPTEAPAKGKRGRKPKQVATA